MGSFTALPLELLPDLGGSDPKPGRLCHGDKAGEIQLLAQDLALSVGLEHTIELIKQADEFLRWKEFIPSITTGMGITTVKLPQGFVFRPSAQGSEQSVDGLGAQLVEPMDGLVMAKLVARHRNGLFF
ncbi:hypothetical protein GCM10023333_34050 [Ferrimonas pelagia]|uniref:Uncharacterized protein n=1 Tax=Ferrimonas pelagia TaxID=1177826 RepID=A0ABP9FCF9_9GAMM